MIRFCFIKIIVQGALHMVHRKNHKHNRGGRRKVIKVGYKRIFSKRDRLTCSA